MASSIMTNNPNINQVIKTGNEEMTIDNTPPTDTVTALSFAPKSNLLAATSWDQKVYIYDINRDLTSSQVLAASATDGPVFSCSWSEDGQNLAAAGFDRKVHLFSQGTEPRSFTTLHDQPIISVRFLAGNSLKIATASWDKTIMLWDERNASKPIVRLECDDKIYAMDTRRNYLHAVTDSREVYVVDLYRPHEVCRIDYLDTDRQPRCIVTDNDGSGYGVGLVDGECIFNGQNWKTALGQWTPQGHVHYDDADETPVGMRKTKTINVYAVNDIAFHPNGKHVATVGSDGCWTIWDGKLRKDVLSSQKRRLFEDGARGPKASGNLTACAFHHEGTIFAYAEGYDWSRGYAANAPDYPLRIVLKEIG